MVKDSTFNVSGGKNVEFLIEYSQINQTDTKNKKHGNKQYWYVNKMPNSTEI